MMHPALALSVGFSFIVAARGEKFCGGFEYTIYPTYSDCENDCLCNCHEPCECNFMGAGFECRASRIRPIFAQPRFEYPETTNRNYEFTTPYATKTNNRQLSGETTDKTSIGPIVIGALIIIGLITICCCGICCCGWFGIKAKKVQPGLVLNSPQHPTPTEPTVAFTNSPHRIAPPAPNPVYQQAPSAPGYLYL